MKPYIMCPCAHVHKLPQSYCGDNQEGKFIVFMIKISSFRYIIIMVSFNIETLNSGVNTQL